MPLSQDLQNAKRNVTAASKVIDSNQSFSKQDKATLKKMLNGFIILFNGLSDEKVSKP